MLKHLIVSKLESHPKKLTTQCKEICSRGITKIFSHPEVF